MSDSPKRSPDEAIPVEPTQTLTEGDIVTERALDRRSMLSVLGTVATAGAVGTVVNGCYATAPGPVYAQPVYAQPARVQTGLNDADAGPASDPAGFGRPPGGPVYVQPAQPMQPMQTGVSDHDSGPGSDPAGRGRGGFRGGMSGVTDGDSGRWSDPAGGGRGNPRGVMTGITDGDSGRWSDPAGGGRGHR